MGRPFWDTSLSLLLFLSILFSYLTFYSSSWRTWRAKDWTSSKQHRRQKNLLPGSHQRFSKTGRTGTTIVLSEPGQQWTREASEIAVKRPRLTGSTTNGDNHCIPRVASGNWLQKSPAPTLRQPGSERTPKKKKKKTLKNTHHRKFFFWKLPIKPELR